METTRQGISALADIANGSSRHHSGSAESELSGSLAAKMSELSGINSDISKLSGEVGLLTLPLERPSRKLDHLSARKRQLHHFISDPVSTIADESIYSEFRKMVAELKEAIENGTVEVKNRDEGISHASMLLNSNIYEMISALKSLRFKKSGIEGEIRTIETAMADIHGKKTDSERAMGDMKDMEEKLAEATNLRESEKVAIEKLFYSCYNKTISIILK